jgi:hypothetical protein
MAVLAAAGAGTFVLAFRLAGSGDDSAVVEPIAKTGARSEPGAPSGTPATGTDRAPELPARTPLTKTANSDPFAPKGWLPPPPPPPPAPAAAPPAPPPPPTAPPVPFKFIGQIEEKSARPAAFISKGEALYVVHVGDVVENTYRVESFNSAQVVVTYLPLQQRQTIQATGG